MQSALEGRLEKADGSVSLVNAKGRNEKKSNALAQNEKKPQTP